jgi:hypothetical protein
LGEISDAINLMIEKVGDVKQGRVTACCSLIVSHVLAIDFVQRQNDPHLWDELIAKSIKNPVSTRSKYSVNWNFLAFFLF